MNTAQKKRYIMVESHILSTVANCTPEYVRMVLRSRRADKSRKALLIKKLSREFRMEAERFEKNIELRLQKITQTEVEA